MFVSVRILTLFFVAGKPWQPPVVLLEHDGLESSSLFAKLQGTLVSCL
jgi:hypothetical protein